MQHVAQPMVPAPALADVNVDDALVAMRRGSRIKVMLAVLGGLIVAATICVVVWIKVQGAPDKMAADERMQEQANIFILPEKEQVARWRALASDPKTDVDLRCEALTQLGLLEDEEAIKLSIKAIEESPSHKLRGSAAQVLAHFGTDAKSSIPVLQKALNEAETGDERQIVWALVAVGDPSIFQKALDLYKAEKITTVQRLEGGAAFDPIRVANLVSLDELAKMADDDSPAVRQLVARILSDNAEPKWTDVLTKLVKDDHVEVSRTAATGLGKIADERARRPLVEALSKADKDSRLKFLQALRDGIGGEGLVLALDTVVKEPEQRSWFQTRQIFDMLHELGDPRASDALVKWVETAKPHKHWETEAGIVLAEAGDVRGAKYIGARMGVEPKDIYQVEKFWQADAGGHMTKTDRPRVIGSRMLADLAVLHPDKREQLLELAEQPVLDWLTSRPQPHANGLRFLAAAKSDKAVSHIRNWAFPPEALPKEGQIGQFPREYETAQSALRYIGWLQDDSSYSKLVDQFDRKKEKDMDITQAGLMGAGRSMLGMALRAVAYGAANGLAQWGKRGDKKVEEHLIEFVEDKTWHEEARAQTCYALAWISSDERLIEIAKKVGEYAAKTDPKDQIIAACFARTLSRAPVPSAVPIMEKMLTENLDFNVRIVLGHAIGITGLKDHPEVEAKLFAKLDNPELRNPAALALILGGSTDTAARAVALYGKDNRKDELSALKDMWFNSFGYWSDADLDRGSLFRWVENAQAISRVKIGDAPQGWAMDRLKAQFDNLSFDNGPHSETRVVLRYRLSKKAREGDSETKKRAIMTLQFMGEKGSLMALREGEGETAELAQKAFHALMNPKALAADDRLKELLEEQNKGRK